MSIPDHELAPRVRVLQIITAALLVGLASFAGVAYFLAQNQPAPKEGATPLITYMGLGMLVLTGGLSFVLPPLLAPGLIQKAVLQGRAEGGSKGTALLGAYQSLHIISMALCEGPGFLCLIGYIVEQQPLALAGAGVAAALIAIRFPTTEGMRSWVRSAGG